MGHAWNPLQTQLTVPGKREKVCRTTENGNSTNAKHAAQKEQISKQKRDVAWQNSTTNGDNRVKKRGEEQNCTQKKKKLAVVGAIIDDNKINEYECPLKAIR